MDPSKKRKMEENGIVSAAAADNYPPSLTLEDARKMIESFSHDQLLDILQNAVVRHVDVLDAVRSANRDIAHRKLFIRGLGLDTTTDGLRALFSVYGELEEAVVILDKTTGKSKGYGFVTFRHVDGALLALKEPSKKIDGRMTVTQLAAAGNSSSNTTANPVSVASADVTQRKIYVANVPYDMTPEKLLAHFSLFGEVEEGPLGFDKQTGKCRGYALFVYKTPEGARAALVDPVKTIEGRQLSCKLAIDGKKGKQGAVQNGVQAAAPGGPGNAPPASMPGQFNGPGGIGSYSGFSGVPQLPIGHHHQHHGLNPSLAGPPGGQGPSSLGAGSGYGAGLSGPYGGYGPNSAGYGGGAGGGLTGAGAGGGSGGMPTGGYPESGHYGLSSSSSAYPNPHHQQHGTSPIPRVPPGGMYPPPYY